MAHDSFPRGSLIPGLHMVTEAEEGADIIFYTEKNAASLYKFGLA